MSKVESTNNVQDINRNSPNTSSEDAEKGHPELNHVLDTAGQTSNESHASPASQDGQALDPSLAAKDEAIESGNMTTAIQGTSARENTGANAGANVNAGENVVAGANTDASENADDGMKAKVSGTNASAGTGLKSDVEDGLHAGVKADVEDGVKADVAGADDERMNNEISRVTGRPRLTKEDNEALRSGARFFHKAMESRARALGEDYTPYRLPPEMRAALAQIDHEAAVEKAKEKAEAEGKDVSKLSESDLELEHSAIEQSHAVSPEEQERLRQEREENAKIESGGARYYSHYQKLISRHNNPQNESAKIKLMRNIKLALIVILALAGYIGYNEFMGSRDAQSISELKAMLPLPVDANTAMVRIDDRNDNFKIYFEREPEVYAGLDQAQRDASLDRLSQNVQMLCNNALLHSIIMSGKKVTVLLDATDGSFHREFSVESCPVE